MSTVKLRSGYNTIRGGERSLRRFVIVSLFVMYPVLDWEAIDQRSRVSTWLTDWHARATGKIQKKTTDTSPRGNHLKKINNQSKCLNISSGPSDWLAAYSHRWVCFWEQPGLFWWQVNCELCAGGELLWFINKSSFFSSCEFTSVVLSFLFRLWFRF